MDENRSSTQKLSQKLSPRKYDCHGNLCACLLSSTQIMARSFLEWDGTNLHTNIVSPLVLPVPCTKNKPFIKNHCQNICKYSCFNVSIYIAWVMNSTANVWGVNIAILTNELSPKLTIMKKYQHLCMEKFHFDKSLVLHWWTTNFHTILRFFQFIINFF